MMDKWCLHYPQCNPAADSFVENVRVMQCKEQATMFTLPRGVKPHAPTLWWLMWGME